jgi:hypothetical protein
VTDPDARLMVPPDVMVRVVRLTSAAEVPTVQYMDVVLLSQMRAYPAVPDATATSDRIGVLDMF